MLSSSTNRDGGVSGSLISSSSAGTKYLCVLHGLIPHYPNSATHITAIPPSARSQVQSQNINAAAASTPNSAANTDTNPTANFSSSSFDYNSNEKTLLNLLDVLNCTTESDSIELLDLHYRQIREIQSLLAHQNALVPPPASTTSAAASASTSASSIFSSLPAHLRVKSNVNKGDTYISLRQDQVARSLVSNLPKRSFSEYHRVYSCEFYDPSKSELHSWREIIPTAITENVAEWQLLYLSKPILPTKHDTLVRQIKCVNVSENYEQFLEFVGYRFDYEYVQEGFVFQDVLDASTLAAGQRDTTIVNANSNQNQNAGAGGQQGGGGAGQQQGAAGGTAAGSSQSQTSVATNRVEIKVYQLLRLDRLNDLTSVHTVRNVKWFVEVRALATDDQLSQVQQKLVKYAKALEPLIRFSKNAPTE